MAKKVYDNSRKNIQFSAQTLTIKSVNLVLDPEYGREPILKMQIHFDDEEKDNSFSLLKTDSVVSEIGIAISIFEILECRTPSEMVGRKLRGLQFRTKDYAGEWRDWEWGGYGSYVSNRYIDMFGDGTIMTVEELKTILEKRELC